MKTKKCLVIGRSGQLATALLKQCPQDVDCVSLSRNDIDLLDIDSIDRVFDSFAPDLVINASAYTGVDKAETDIDSAYALNCSAVANLARLTSKRGIRFIHISTDFVFGGEFNRAYLPDDQTNPLSVYGLSKRAGETEILKLLSPLSCIVRTSWVYSLEGGNFVKTMLRLMSERKSINVVSDQIGCPTYVLDLASFIWALREQIAWVPIYHWSDLGVASWYDFSEAIHDLALSEGIIKDAVFINPIKTVEYPTPAIRPKFSLLDVSASQGIHPGKHWRKNLALFFSSYKGGQR